ncbi:MAG: pyridoxal kinase PdxY [Alphaproteobacteria bacterium]|nr:pyridoxal kinase PdxY [Alphaproteobacteria bacterium]
MNILSIQSAVSYGHVGNSAAVFPLQRLGFEVWPIDTLQFSNHPGYGAFRGRVFEPELVADLVTGMAERGALASCDAVLSGYLGDAATGAAVLDAVAKVKAANPKALYCCDPVIGDSGPGVYVRGGIPEFFRERALPAADILTPNRFELEHLTGRPAATIEAALAAAEMLRSKGPRVILATSLEREGAPPDTVEMLAVDASGAWLVATPRLPFSVNGAGDAVAALFLGHFLKTGDTAAALGATASSIFAVLEATQRAGMRELQLVAAQDEVVAPQRRFTAEKIR